MVQVDDIVVSLCFQLLDHQFPTMGQYMQFVDIRIMLNHGPELILHQEMNFSIRHLLLQATDDGCGEDDITDGGEPYDEEFWNGLLFMVLISNIRCQIFGY
jgi:hypothetical protein